MVADRKLISYDIICKQCPVLVNVNRDEGGFQLALFAQRHKLEQEMRSCPTFHSYRSIVKRVLQGWLILRLFYPLLDYSIGCYFNVFLLEQGRKLYSLSLDVDSMLTVNIVEHRWFILSLLEFNFLFNSTRSLSVTTYRSPIPISRVYSKIWCSNIRKHRKSFEYFLISIRTESSDAFQSS